MKKKWSLKGQNQGASLIAVLLALVFVGMLGVVITNLTITNIQMREVERAEKKNFYTAEEIMDELSVGLNALAADAMQSAYTKVLTDYRDIMLNGKDIQHEFTNLYLEELTKIFWDKDNVLRGDLQQKTDSGATVYVIGNYKTDTVKDCLLTPETKACFVTQEEKASFEADYKEGVFTLRNVKIQYTDAEDYSTDITTDMVFHTPVLNFDNQNVIKEFMRYVLIADNQIKINAANIKVNGSIYAGAGGIAASGNGNSAIFTGNSIVTRGDIAAESGTTLELGTDTSKLWAENVRTKGKGTPSHITLNGNSYISDDLVLSGSGSTVTLNGNYYGYNFQDNYGDVHTINDASYSSAMMINAKDCKIDMQNLNYLLLAGRTYLSRGSAGNSQNNDIALGESLSVRTNQLAYYISEKYLDTTDASHIFFTEEGKAAYEAQTNVTDFMDYLDAASPVVPYYFRDNGTQAVRYYLNFKSEQDANSFYSAYYAANSSKINQNAAAYVTDDALLLNDGMIYTLKGDILYRDRTDGSLNTKTVTIQPADWKTAGAGGTDGLYWTFAKNLSIQYKSLQLYLEDAHAGITADDVRIVDAAGNVDKKQQPLFDTIIDRVEFVAENPVPVNVNAVTPIYTESLSGGGYKEVVVVNNAGTDAYRMKPELKEGIVIATGDVEVEGSFRGMIISGGTISFAANASVTSDEILVAELFQTEMTVDFQKYFKDYDTFSESVIGMVKVEDYLTYDNWKKNGD